MQALEQDILCTVSGKVILNNNQIMPVLFWTLFRFFQNNPKSSWGTKSCIIGLGSGNLSHLMSCLWVSLSIHIIAPLPPSSNDASPWSLMDTNCCLGALEAWNQCSLPEAFSLKMACFTSSLHPGVCSKWLSSLHHTSGSHLAFFKAVFRSWHYSV
jgi:hypothetical protein